MHITWDEYFMGVALLSAKRSKDPSTQVGACIVNADKRIIGIGYNPATNESKVSDFAERIINLIGVKKIEELGIPGLLGYKFVYSEDELRSMSEDELLDAVNNGYVDDEGNSLYDNNQKIAIDRRIVNTATKLVEKYAPILCKAIVEEDTKYHIDLGTDGHSVPEIE